MGKTYRKKAFRLEIVRGERAPFAVHVDGNDTLLTPEKAMEIIKVVGEEALNGYLRPAKILKAREPTGI